MIHLRTAKSVLCKARKGYKTSDLWQVNCPACLEVLREIQLTEELRKNAGLDGERDIP
jgi:hypothetical protein